MTFMTLATKKPKNNSFLKMDTFLKLKILYARLWN